MQLFEPARPMDTVNSPAQANKRLYSPSISKGLETAEIKKLPTLPNLRELSFASTLVEYALL